MKAFFTDLFTYNHQVNFLLIERLLTGEAPSKAMELMSHTLIVQQLWNHRITGQPVPAGFWKTYPSETFHGMNDDSHKESLDILESYDLDSIAEYTNSKNLSFRSAIRDILFHIINHSTYHRGQINARLRESGMEPVITDYVFYKR